MTYTYSMNIGIIGSGNIGSTLARQLTALGHEVMIANSRGPASLAALAAETGSTAVTVEQACSAKDIIIVAIPEAAIPSLASLIPQNTSAIVVDAGNYYPARDGQIAGIDDGLTDSEWVSKVLGVPVVKAFNNIVAPSLDTRGVPPEMPGRICLSVAADDPHSKESIMRLISELGFDSVDGGSLADSWRQHPGSPAYCKDLNISDLKDALARADIAEVTTYRAEADESIRAYL